MYSPRILNCFCCSRKRFCTAVRTHMLAFFFYVYSSFYACHRKYLPKNMGEMVGPFKNNHLCKLSQCKIGNLKNPETIKHFHPFRTGVSVVPQSLFDDYQFQGIFSYFFAQCSGSPFFIRGIFKASKTPLWCLLLPYRSNCGKTRQGGPLVCMGAPPLCVLTQVINNLLRFK